MAERSLIGYDALAIEQGVSTTYAGDRVGAVLWPNGRRICAFPNGTNENFMVTRDVQIPPNYEGGTLRLYLYWIAWANSGNVYWQVVVDSIGSGDSTGLGYDFLNPNYIIVAAPAVTYNLKVDLITLTHADAAVAGDIIKLGIRRNSASASDTCAALAAILALELRELL